MIVNPVSEEQYQIIIRAHKRLALTGIPDHDAWIDGKTRYEARINNRDIYLEKNW